MDLGRSDSFSFLLWFIPFSLIEEFHVIEIQDLENQRLDSEALIELFVVSIFYC